MFLLKSEKILPDLVIDQALRNIPPTFWWRGVMDDQKQRKQYGKAAASIKFINLAKWLVEKSGGVIDRTHEDHCRSAHNCSSSGCPPCEVPEARSEVGRAPDFQKKAGKIGN